MILYKQKQFSRLKNLQLKISIIVNTLKYSKVSIIKFDFEGVLSKFRTLLMKLLTFYEF